VLKIVILPVGQVAADVLKSIQSGLKDIFPKIEVDVLKTVMAIPREAYNSSRRQYHSTYILAKVDDYVGKAKAKHVLGVAELDLYVPNLNFVFGEAQCLGRAALISLFRLKPEFYGAQSNRELFLERALKEAVHEIGHTLGLGHCKNSFCVMFFSNSIKDTDEKRAEFCEQCRLMILRALEN